MAVLGKRAGVRTARQDVFLSVAGGLKLQEPAGASPTCPIVRV